MRQWVRQSREDRQAGTRARLIACAHDVFLRQGFHAATLEAIALQAGVTKGAVYSNFESKAALFLAVNGTRMEARLRNYRRVRETSTRLETFMREFARIMVRDDPDGRWASVVAEAWAVAAGDERFRAAVINQLARGNVIITDAVADLADRAGFRFRLPREQMGRLGSALMRGLLLQRLLDPKAVSREFIEEAFVTFIQGMAQPRPSSRRRRRDHDEHTTGSPRREATGTPALLNPAAVQRLAGEFSARDRWSRPALLEIQQQRLDSLIEHAASASRYYRHAIGTAVGGRRRLEDLPILTKSRLMDEWDRIVTDPRLRLRDVEAHLAGEHCGELCLGEYRAFATGGTTGERAVVVYDSPDWLAVIANMVRWVGTVGARPEWKVVGIGAPTPLHVTNRAFAELRAGRSDVPRLSVLTPLPEIVRKLNDYQPEMILTYPSFARRLIEEQEAGRLRICPNCVASTAEVLAADIRRRIQETWNARVLDSYGTTEGGLLGTECDAAQGIHIAEDMVVFEVVDDRNRRVPEGRAGSKVLVTNLFNRTLPLIRYEISDLVTLDSSPCVCGRPYARVTAIEGRREDYMTLRAAAGGTIRIHAARLRAPLVAVAGLRQFQVVPAGSRVKLRLAIRGGADVEAARAAATTIVSAALRKAGAAVSLTVELVEAIECAGTGAKEKLVAAN